MDQRQRMERAQKRSLPHLDVAMERIVDHGVDPSDAAVQMILFGAGVIMARNCGGPSRSSVLMVRDYMHELLTASASQFDATGHPMPQN